MPILRLRIRFATFQTLVVIGEEGGLSVCRPAGRTDGVFKKGPPSMAPRRESSLLLHTQSGKEPGQEEGLSFSSVVLDHK